MNNQQIQLSYRQIINIHSVSEFEKKVFEDSYKEFLMQSQTYNKEEQFTSFQQLIDNNPKANSLHYKVGFSVGLYIKALNNKIPGLRDTLNQSVSFNTFNFEIVSSDIRDKNQHQVAITYTTDWACLINGIALFREQL